MIRGGREGYDRLRILARARWPDTADLLARAGVRRGMRCVDLGCGGGEVTFELARLVGAAGHVTGVDMDEVKLSLARASAMQRGCSNVAFRVGNVADWDEPGGYDLVYCRFLLQHLSRPADLLRRMWAAVTPGGTIVVEDADFEGLLCHPPNDGFAFYSRVYPRVLALHGGDAAIGRKLYRYFLEAGIPDPNLRLVQRADANGEAKTLSLTTLEATADAIVEEGLASIEEVTAAIADLGAFTADRTTVVGDPRVFQLWCSRAGPDTPEELSAAATSP